jgi:hypothetical protein
MEKHLEIEMAQYEIRKSCRLLDNLTQEIKNISKILKDITYEHTKLEDKKENKS